MQYKVRKSLTKLCFAAPINKVNKYQYNAKSMNLNTKYTGIATLPKTKPNSRGKKRR